MGHGRTADEAARPGGRMLASSGVAYTEFRRSCKRRPPCASGDARGEKQAMTTLPITLTIAGASALMAVWLGLRVSLLRRRHKVSVGDGGNQAVLTRMRAHANFIEYTPIFLILLGLVELAKGSHTALWAVAILYIVGRLAHVFGMDRPAPNALRVGGVVLTWLCLLGLAAYALIIPYTERGVAPISPAYAELDARASTLSATKWLVRRS